MNIFIGLWILLGSTFWAGFLLFKNSKQDEPTWLSIFVSGVFSGPLAWVVLICVGLVFFAYKICGWIEGIER